MQYYIEYFVSCSGCSLNFEKSSIVQTSCCVFTTSISFIGNVFSLRKQSPEFLKIEVFKLRNVRVNILKLQFSRQMSKTIDDFLLLKSRSSECPEMRKVEEGKKTVWVFS